MATVDELIDRAIQVGNDKSDAAQSLADQAVTATLGASFINPILPAATPVVTEPGVYIPTHATGVDHGLFSATYQRIIDDLSDKFAQFLTEFFPTNLGLLNQVEAWLQQAIQDGGTGVNPVVEAKIWQRDRDRITTESLSSTEEAVSSWATRGFPLPPGAANATLQAIAQKRTAALNAQSRDVAIKAWEQEVENVKFAITTAISSRSQAIQAAGDYIRAMALGPQLATQLATSASDAQARLISASSSYYNARINVAELAQRRNLAISDLHLKAATQSSDNAVRYANMRASTAATLATSLGQQAAAALNAVNATVQKIGTED